MVRAYIHIYIDWDGGRGKIIHPITRLVILDSYCVIKQILIKLILIIKWVKSLNI